VYPIDTLPGFLGAIFDTAQNYRDNTQARMPSYRERVVHIRLGDNEGGLNLNMDPEVIKHIEDKGLQAAEALGSFDFDQHRWVRLLVLLARLENEFGRLREHYEQEAVRKNRPPERWADEMRSQYEGLLREQVQHSDTDTAWYKMRKQEWCTEADKRVQALVQLMETWNGRQRQWTATHGGTPYFFSYDEPIPEGILRVTPEN
jgi:hypothetical protein